MGEWIEVADKNEINDVLDFEYKGQEIVVIKLKEKFYALDNVCSHEYARLSEGELWDNWIYCPKHGSCFDVCSGDVKGFPATEGVKTFPVKIEDNKVYIQLEEEW